MQLQKPPRPCLPLSVSMGAAQLYEARAVGAPLEAQCSPPALELSTEVMHTLWTLGTKLTEYRLHGFLLAHKAKLTKHTLQVSDVQWHSSRKPLFSAGQFGIPLRYCTASDVPAHLSALGHSVQTSAASVKDPVQLLDWLRVECYLTIEGKRASLHFLQVWPSLGFAFQPIAPLRIVSTELAVRLIKEKREDAKLRSGVLTMDTGKRVILLRAQDPHTATVPVVGLWLSSVSRAKPDLALLWAHCVRFLLAPSLQRLSNSPLTLSFLVLLTTSPPCFYEVSTAAPAGWQLSSASVPLSGAEPSDMTVQLHFAEALRASVSSEASTRTSSDSLQRPLSCADDLIKEQTLVLRDLERQLTELKKQVFSNAVPHTARTRTERGLDTERTASYAVSLATSPLNSPRHSLPVSRRSPPRDLLVPRIQYRSESDTSEDSHS